MSAQFKPVRTLRNRDQFVVDKVLVRTVAQHYQISESSAEVLLYTEEEYESPWY